ncbi:MAG: hypothetical protein R2827_12130 [Bdellovibrionales bacterium]
MKQEFDLRFALDINSGDLVDNNMIDPKSIDVLCCKPARNVVEPMEKWCIENHVPILFTHYMDSPLGQKMALVEAKKVLQRSPQIEIANGLRAHSGYFNLEVDA